jgi:hypothetical protein
MSRPFDDDWKATTAVILALILLIIWLWMNRNGGGGGGRRKGGGGRMARSGATVTDGKLALHLVPMSTRSLCRLTPKRFSWLL